MPVRLAKEDLSDDDAFKNDQGEFVIPADETLPGHDAFELLAREPFVLLSGRPGSGKTTFVHAVVVALADRQRGQLREKLGAVPVPFILRRLERLGEIRSLDELFAAWWPETETQAAKDGLPLDRECLEAVFRSPGQGHLEKETVLLLFDGIDEVGGPETRQRLLDLAFEARAAGYRVLVTGRPTGYADLSEPLPVPDAEEGAIRIGEIRRLALHHM